MIGGKNEKVIVLQCSVRQALNQANSKTSLGDAMRTWARKELCL